MSVMLLSMNHFKMAYQKACSFQFRKTVDIDYCYSLSMSEIGLRALFKSWWQMNSMCYCARYDYERSETAAKKAFAIIDSWRYDSMKEKQCDTYQMLKLLQCIRYNIEESILIHANMTVDKDALEVLDKAIFGIMNRIVSENRAYKDAKWCIE